MNTERRIANRKLKLYCFIMIGITVVSGMLIFVARGLASEDMVSDIKSGRTLDLTSEEKQFVNEHSTITVAADTSWCPLEYMNEGEYSGVIANVLERLEEYTGFTIKYDVKGSYIEALEAVKSGEADMISGLASDETIAAEYNVNLSKPYIVINSAVVTKDAQNSLYGGDENKKIAVVDGDYANAEIEKKIKGSNLVKCSTNEECLQKVCDKDVDIAIIASYCAEYYMSIPKFSTLKANTISDFSWQQSFGISKKDDMIMLQIINKGIDKILELDINELVYDGVSGARYDNGLVVFIYKHPILVIGIVLFIVFIIVTVMIIAFQTRKKEQLRAIEDGVRLKLALERTHLCIWEMDVKTGKITKVDNENEKHGFYEIRENIVEQAIEKGYIHPEDIQLIWDTFRKVKNGEQDVIGCWRIREIKELDNKSTNTYWWEQVLFRIIYDEKKHPIKIIGVSEDVTKEKNAQRDALTLVYNRNSFEKKATTILSERRNAYLQCAFIILDLDGFKKINDTYGHSMGDRVLISVGTTLNKTFRSTDIVGRLGGDEFTVFMTSVREKEDAIRKGQELVENVNKIKDIEGYPFDVSCSVGIVVAYRGEEDLATLYKRADSVLYEAKRAGKNQCKLYE